MTKKTNKNVSLNNLGKKEKSRQTILFVQQKSGETFFHSIVNIIMIIK